MRRWHAERSRQLERAAVVAEQHTKRGLANPHRIRQHGFEYWLKIARRT
jgi:hypothetical protein